MLDMGFLPAIRRITAVLPRDRQTMCFSATLEASVAYLVTSFMQTLGIRMERMQANPGLPQNQDPGRGEMDRVNSVSETRMVRPCKPRMESQPSANPEPAHRTEKTRQSGEGIYKRDSHSGKLGSKHKNSPPYPTMSWLR